MRVLISSLLHPSACLSKGTLCVLHCTTVCPQSWCLPFGKGEFQHHGGITLEVLATLATLALSDVSAIFADWRLCTGIDHSVEAHRVGLQAPPGCAQAPKNERQQS